MVQLLFTCDAFRPFGQPQPGVPMLLDKEMRLIEPACGWLLHIALIRGRASSPQTWRTYGEALADWWNTLEANGWDWDRVSFNELAAYRHAMLSRPSSVTGRAYARSTINLRLRVVSLFYEWCARQAIATDMTAAFEDVRLSGAQVGGDPGMERRAVNALTLPSRTRLPRPLTQREVQEVRAGLGVRDRLIVDWALLTGMRRMEIANLAVADLPRSSDSPVARVDLSITKGRRRRVVYPPRRLLDRTLAYVREERSEAVRRGRLSGLSDAKELFLKNDGMPLTPERIGSMFSRAAARRGVKGTFHSLRHTFAASMLAHLTQLAKGRQLNPLLTLQVLLGHAQITTTQIYTHVVASDLEAVEGTVDEIYGALT